MKKIKIGIPRTCIYNKKGVLLKNYLIFLGCKIILSNETNIEKENNLPTDTCNYNKEYFKNIIKQTNSSNYIVIKSNCEYYQKCQKYKKFIDVIKCHIDNSQILMINPYKYELLEYFKMGFKITKNPLRIIVSYYLAKQKQKRYTINKNNYEKNKLNNDKQKVLLIANYNNIENNPITKYIINKLKENNITTLLSSNVKEKEAMLHSSFFENRNISKETKLLVGSIYYYRYCVRGIIYLTIPNCTIDKYIINIVKNEIKEMPIISIETTEIIENIETILKMLTKEISKYK